MYTHAYTCAHTYTHIGTHRHMHQHTNLSEVFRESGLKSIFPHLCSFCRCLEEKKSPSLGEGSRVPRRVPVAKAWICLLIVCNSSWERKGRPVQSPLLAILFTRQVSWFQARFPSYIMKSWAKSQLKNFTAHLWHHCYSMFWKLPTVKIIFDKCLANS